MCDIILSFWSIIVILCRIPEADKKEHGSREIFHHDTSAIITQILHKTSMTKSSSIEFTKILLGYCEVTCLIFQTQA